MVDIKKRFEALQKATPRLRNSSAHERKAKIKALWNAILDHKDALFDAAHEERYTVSVDVAAEIVMLKAEADYVLKRLPKWVKPHRVRNTLFTMGKKCEIRYQSKGVVLNLPAFNAPTAETFVPMISAMAAGNTIAIKPSELAPKSAQVIADIIHSTLPEDEAIVFQGGVDVAQELLRLPFNHFYYTGGNTVGKLIMKAAADHFASVTLEMGGKSPVIIDETAKLENAATKIAWGRVINAGQVCVAPEYAIVHENVAAQFIDLIKEKMEALYNSEGTGLQKSAYVPRIINTHHYKRIVGLLDDATKKGAKIVYGGDHDKSECFIAPTVLTDMSEDMDIMQQEVFGPILSVLTYSTREEVLDIITKRPTPLAFYIYSTHKDTIEYFLTNSSSGSAVVNNNCVQAGTNPNLPFGGVGASGMGRASGFGGFKEMSNARTVMHQPLDRLRDIMMQLPPYSARYENLIMRALKK